MPYRFNALSFGAIATLTLLSLTGCGSPQQDSATTLPEVEAPSSPAITEPIAEPAAAEPAAEPQAAEAPADATASTTDSTASPSYDPQPLTTDALAQIESELGSSEEVFSDHSFTLDVPDLGNVAFVASRSSRPDGKPFGSLVMRLRFPDGEYQPLVPANPGQEMPWNFWSLNAVAFEDVNGDGLGPDIVAIADYMTGAGPEAAQPFPVTTVQFREPSGFFIADAEVDEQLSSEGISTIAEVRNALGQ